MPKYKYVLSSKAGKKEEGSTFASNIDAAREKLKGENKILLAITEDKRSHTYFWQKPHLSFEEKLMFTKHLATMIKVGISVIEALETLKGQARSKNNRRMYKNMIEKIKSGQTLAKSLEEYDYIFSGVFISMVATGEKSGRLEQVLEYLDIQMEKEYTLRKKVISAFIYPVLIMSIALLVALGIVLFIMPKITKMFKQFDVDLPFVTRALIGFSTFLLEKPIYSVLIVVAIIGFFTILFKIKALKPFWDKLSIYFPIFGRVLIYANLARFSRTMNSLLQSGVPVTEALEINSKMANNGLYKKAIAEAREKVQQGGKLGESLESNQKIFPPLSTKMLEIGEKSGSLDVATEGLATLYERNVDTITKNLSVLLEPILLLFITVIVGGIAISIILPIYQLPSLLSK